MKIIHQITIAIILLGLLVGYGKADYNYDPYGLWNSYYYVWSKLVDLLLILCILNPAKELRVAWVSIAIFFLIRLVWQFFAIKDYVGVSRPSVIFLLFLFEILVICFLSIYTTTKRIILNLKKWQRQN